MTEDHAVDPIFSGYLLLRTPAWDARAFLEDFEADWGVKIDEAVPADPEAPLVFKALGSIFVLCFKREADPDADEAAKNNRAWPDAADVVRSHVAQVAVAAIPETASLLRNAENFVRVMASLTLQPNALAVHSVSTVYTREGYRNGAHVMTDGRSIPIFNLVYFGTWRRSEAGGTCGYTAGLSYFGMHEMEVLESSRGADTVRDFLCNLSRWLLAHDRKLADGDVIASHGHDFKVTLSKGEALPDEVETLKIEIG